MPLLPWLLAVKRKSRRSKHLLLQRLLPQLLKPPKTLPALPLVLLLLRPVQLTLLLVPPVQPPVLQLPLLVLLRPPLTLLATPPRRLLTLLPPR